MDIKKIREETLNYKEEMTPGERSQKYASGERVDHLPYTLHMPDMAVGKYLGYKVTDLDDFEVFKEVKDYLRDVLGLGSNINHRLSLRTMGYAMGSKKEEPDDGIDFISERVLEDYEDFDKLLGYDPWENPVTGPLLEKGKEIREKMPDYTMSTGVVCPLSTAVAIRPIEKILKDTRKHPQDLHRLLDLCVDYNLKFVQAFTDEFGKASASISAPLMSTDILNEGQEEEYGLRYLEKLVDGLYEITGKKPSLHICGHSKGIWDRLKELNISSFSVDNCEDLEELKKAMGDTIHLVGNIPPVDVMRFGSPEDVVNTVKECIEKAADSPSGYTLATGCQVPVGTPEDNLLAFVWAVREYSKGAKKGRG